VATILWVFVFGYEVIILSRNLITDWSCGCRNSRFWNIQTKIITRMVKIRQNIGSQNRVGAAAPRRDPGAKRTEMIAKMVKMWGKINSQNQVASGTTRDLAYQKTKEGPRLSGNWHKKLKNKWRLPLLGFLEQTDKKNTPTDCWVWLFRTCVCTPVHENTHENRIEAPSHLKHLYFLLYIRWNGVYYILRLDLHRCRCRQQPTRSWLGPRLLSV